MSDDLKHDSTLSGLNVDQEMIIVENLWRKRLLSDSKNHDVLVDLLYQQTMTNTHLRDISFGITQLGLQLDKLSSQLDKNDVLN